MSQHPDRGPGSSAPDEDPSLSPPPTHQPAPRWLDPRELNEWVRLIFVVTPAAGFLVAYLGTDSVRWALLLSFVIVAGSLITVWIWARPPAAVRAAIRELEILARDAFQHADSPSTRNNSWFEARHDTITAVLASGGSTTHGAGPLPRGARRWWFRLATSVCVWYATAGSERLTEWRAVVQLVEMRPRRRWQLAPSRSVERAWIANDRAAIARRSGENLTRAEEGLISAAKGRLGWYQVEGQVKTNQALLLERQARSQRTPERLRTLARALQLLEEAEAHRARSDLIGQALTHHGYGLTYHQMAQVVTQPAERRNHLADASKHLAKAASLFRVAKERRGEAVTLTAQTLVAGDQSHPHSAQSFGQAALDLYEELRRDTGWTDREGRAAVLLNLAAVELTVSEPRLDQARAWLEESLHLHEEGTPGWARTQLYLGDLARRQDDPDEAEQWWREADKIFERDDDHDGLAALTRRPFRPTPEQGEESTA